MVEEEEGSRYRIGKRGVYKTQLKEIFFKS
jgi:hypothetical protein